MNQDSAITTVALASFEYKPASTLKRVMFIVIGTVALGLGILGAYLPGMPSTVFFLIAIGSYTRGSERLYRWMLSRTWLQGPLRTALSYQQHKAVPVGIKIFAQSVAWSSALFLIFSGRTLIAQCMGIALALSCSIAMALLRTMADGRAPRRWTASRRDMWAQLGFGALAGGIAATGWLPFAAGAWRFAANFSPSPAFAPAGVPLLVIGALTFGLAAGMAYAALRRALPANQWLCGVVFGAACAALIALFVGATSTELRAVSLAIPGLIGITIVAAGLAASLIFGQFERVKA
jgi:uncharacterized membrane protein YbaN (DUF454 family)